LGVKYVTAREPDNSPDLELIGIADGGIYYQRKDAFPRAWVAKNIVVEPDDEAVRHKVNTGSDDLKETIFLDHAVDCPSAGGDTMITEYRPNDVSINVSGSGGIMTLSDQYYPGWRAYIDGQPTEILRADTIFRAVCVPTGDHTVKFEYRPLSIVIGMIITAVSWLALLLFGVSRLAFRRRRSSPIS
jgi:hypothetical protein